MNVRVRWTILWLTALSGALVAPSVAEERRGLTIDDVLAIEQVGQIAVSPDGQTVAVVIKRGRTTSESYKRDFLWDNNRADVWLVPAHGTGAARNLTRGAVSGSGYWNPVWSPDGRYLAMFSTSGGDNVRLQIWDRDAHALRQVSPRGVQLPPGAFGFEPHNPILWIGPRVLLCPMLSEGEQPFAFRVETQTPDLASRAWPLVRRGVEATPSVLDSALRSPNGRLSLGGELVLWDVASGRSTPIAGGIYRDLVLSPDGRHVAIAKELDPIAPAPNRRLAWVDAPPAQLGLVTLGAVPSVAWMDLHIDPFPSARGASPSTWSPDGRYLAVVSRTGGEPNGSALFVIDTKDGRARRIATAGDTPQTTAWTDRGDLLVRVGDEKTSRWLTVQPAGDVLELSSLRSKSAPPAELFTSPSESIVLGVSNGVLLQVDVQANTTRPLLSHLGQIAAVRWPKSVQRAQRSRSMVIEGVEGGVRRLFRLDVGADAATATPMPVPAPDAALAAFAPGVGVFTLVGADGTDVWTSDGERHEPRFTLNRHLAHAADAERRLVTYRNGDGERLHALLLLPSNRKDSDRHPLVVSVYPGTIIRQPRYFQAAKNAGSALNLLLMTARGYAVLVPSIPLGPEGEASDPALDIAKSVLPAVERVIELNVVDPDRLALMGQSYGAYGVYCLLTQTRIFRAAIAIGGMSDLVSLYGAFDARERYTTRAHEPLLQARFAEGGQLRMGAAPWQDAARYVRNSPIFTVDRIHTPLLIVQGDLDFVGIQQGEEMFTALYRLGRRARFVRYWGEGHGVESPANIRDLWRRMTDWLEDCWN